MEDVLIVGAGPTGLYLGCQLRQHGIPVLIIDKRLQPESHSKALTINTSSLKLLHDIGLAEGILETARKVQHFYVHYAGKKLLHIDFSTLPDEFNLVAMQPQAHTEQLLLDYFIEHGGRLVPGSELVDIAAGRDCVRARVRSTGGSWQDIYAHFLIGCDGGRSTVREHLQIGFRGHNYPMYFVMADLEVEWDGPRQYVHYFVRDEGFIILIPLTRRLHRIVVKLDGVYAENVEPTLADFQRYATLYGPPGIVLKNPVWISSAPFYNRIADTNRAGRVLLAGDAVHLFSPIGGLGMNTGLQDAMNLAWKLAYVLKGYASESLLETYTIERMAIDRLLLAQTDLSTNVISRALRDDAAVARFLPTFANRHFMRQVVAPQTAGILHACPHGVLVRDDRAEVADSCAGRLAPDISDWRRSGLRFGKGRLTLLLFTDSRPLLRGFLQQLPRAWRRYLDVWRVVTAPHGDDVADCHRVLVDKPAAMRAAFGCAENALILVRPDLYIGYAGELALPEQFFAYMAAAFSSEVLADAGTDCA